jgi:hypothetical protein
MKFSALLKCLGRIRAPNRSKRSQDGHCFVESLIFMAGAFLILLVFSVPIVKFGMSWFAPLHVGKDPHPLIVLGISVVASFAPLAMVYLIERPASVLGLHLFGGSPIAEWDHNHKNIVGYWHLTRRSKRLRNGFRALAVLLSLAFGYWMATTHFSPQLSPREMMVCASMAGLVPVALLFGLLGKIFPVLYEHLNEQTRLVPCTPF